MGGIAPRYGRLEAEQVAPRAAASRAFKGGPLDAHILTSFSSESTSKLVFAAADGGARPSSTATAGPAHASLGLRTEKRLRAVDKDTKEGKVQPD